MNLPSSMSSGTRGPSQSTRSQKDHFEPARYRSAEKRLGIAGTTLEEPPFARSSQRQKGYAKRDLIANLELASTAC